MVVSFDDATGCYVVDRSDLELQDFHSAYGVWRFAVFGRSFRKDRRIITFAQWLEEAGEPVQQVSTHHLWSSAYWFSGALSGGEKEG